MMDICDLFLRGKVRKDPPPPLILAAGVAQLLAVHRVQ